jgi:hypothetical protein
MPSLQPRQAPAPELFPYRAPAAATSPRRAFMNKPYPFPSSYPISFLLNLTHTTAVRYAHHASPCAQVAGRASGFCDD